MSVLQIQLIYGLPRPLDYHVWVPMLKMYRCYTKTDTYGTEEAVCKLSGLTCLNAQINGAITVVPQKAPGVQKAAGGHFERIF